MEKVIALGDSVLLGVIKNNSGYRISENSFARQCEKKLNIEIQNLSKFGASIDDGIRILEKNSDRIAETDGDYVVLEFGGNDCDFLWKEIAENPDGLHYPRTNLKEFHEKYLNLLDNIRQTGKEPIILSLPPIDSVQYTDLLSGRLETANIYKWLDYDKYFLNGWHEIYNYEVMKIANEYSTGFIDITSPFLRYKNYNSLLCEDGIHPNDDGHTIIAEEICSSILSRSAYI